MDRSEFGCISSDHLAPARSPELTSDLILRLGCTASMNPP
jgi:hypothetical protein